MNTFAQSLRYGVMAGIQSSHPKNLDSRTGFRAGIYGEVDFHDNDNTMYLNSGLLLSAKGWSEDTMTAYAEADPIKWKTRLYYLEIPVHIGYRHTANENVTLLASCGPYFAVGISGSSKFDSKGQSLADNDNPYDGNLFSNGMYRRFDFGAGARAGIELYGHFQITAGYDMSFIKPTKGMWNSISTKDRTCDISLAYLF